MLPVVAMGQMAESGISNTKSSTDTLQKSKRGNDSIYIYYFLVDDTTATKLDSSIHLIHRNPLLTVWENDLGNFGSSATTNFYQLHSNIGNTLGIQQGSKTMYRLEHLRYFHSTKPYTTLLYRLGSKQEQMIELLHTRNVNPFLNISAEYKKVGSPGTYLLQRTNNDQFSLSSNYRPKGKRYTLTAAFIYNKLQQDENGGIISENYLEDPRYNNKRLVPVNFENNPTEKNRSMVTNYFRNIQFDINHQYYFGKTESALSADSAEMISNFTPIFGFKHHLYASGSLYKYKDLSPDSLVYSKLGIFSFGVDDSVYGRSAFQQLGNSFSLTGNIPIRKTIFEAEAGYGNEIEKFTTLTNNTNSFNNYVFAKLDKQNAVNNSWLLQGELKFYFTGNTKGNTLLQAKAGKKISEQLGEIVLGFQQNIQASSYLQKRFETNFYTLSSNTKKQINSKFQFMYLLNKYQASLSVNYHLIGNFIYRDTSLMVKQYQPIMPITQIHLQKLFNFKRFYFQTDILYQIASKASPIHIPKLATMNRFYYENAIFKTKLRLSTGFDTRYHTAFAIDEYSPLLYGFVSQYTRNIANIPRVSYFFNCKVKSFRGAISFDELQQLLYRNNINYSKYPAQNFMMHFGVYWSFVN
ncbi:MAG: hypothetical protein IPI46_11030 [Bacteroidetes bacterium]|nr:hypothetical protein [Bacteroidota bacterium]